MLCPVLGEKTEAQRGQAAPPRLQSQECGTRFLPRWMLGWMLYLVTRTVRPDPVITSGNNTSSHTCH
jgi:hypothetical protein